MYAIIKHGVNRLAVYFISSLTELTTVRRAENTGTIGYVLMSKLHGNRRMSGVNLKPPGGSYLRGILGHQTDTMPKSLQRITPS